MVNLLQQRFSENVLKFGDRTALETDGHSITYAELNKLVSRIQLALVTEGVRQKAVIVFNDHSIQSYAAILALNFSGNTVLPVDPKWPQKRLEDIVQIVQPAGVIFSDDAVHFASFFLGDKRAQHLFHLQVNPANFKIKPRLNIGVDYEDLAYVISTSGSTGMPKFVPVKQEGLSSFISFFQFHFDFNESDRFLQTFDITFDVAYFSFLMPLCYGACCCVLTQNKSVPKYLSIVNDLQTRGITVLCMVSTVLHFIKKYISRQDVKTVRFAFLTADVLYHTDAQLLNSYLPKARLFNFYGPSEATIFCTWYEWLASVSEKEIKYNLVPIGRPFSDIEIKIIDEAGNDIGEGEVGELALSGAQIIERYLGVNNRDVFFIDDNEDKCKLFYKTGDLVSINSNGNLLLHGRRDLQVKINGYRIELDEIQVAIQKLTGRKCVVVKQETGGATFLRAVIEGQEVDTAVLKDRLSELLPDYMIPAEIMFIDKLPVNDNGKIDKKLLQSL